MISALKLWREGNLLVDLEAEIFPASVNVESNYTNYVSFDLLVYSSSGATIELKCFKEQPPPPGFKPCPEAGTIVLPGYPLQQVGAQFSLPSVDENDFNIPGRSYLLTVRDDESRFDIIINLSNTFNR